MFNETIIVTKSVINSTAHYLSDDLFNRGIAIIDAPFKIPEMLWMLVPILATIVLMEFYFGRYKEEELGWNTAFGNSLVLGFVAIDLFRFTHRVIGGEISDALFSSDPKIIISMIIFGFAVLLVLMDFFHFIPKKIAYVISSSSFVHMIALLGIIIVYSTGIPFDWTTLFACLVVFLFANLLLHILYWIIPAYKSPFQRILTAEDIERYSNSKKTVKKDDFKKDD
ncbi:MAG: hypothetical protein ACP5NV_05545 [Candidatus Woesearchaeota archaeon]